MKRVISILLAVILALALAAGCANAPAAPAAPPDQTPAAPSPAAPSPANPDPAAPATPAEPNPDPAPDAVPIMISAAELQGVIGDENLILIGVVSPSAALVPFSNAANPIRGSFLVWGDDYLGTNTEALSTEVTMFRVPLGDMENLLSRAGITADSQIVVFSSDWLSQGAYVAWQLSLLGLNVRFLDGGVAAWREIRGQTGSSSRLSGESVKSDFKAPRYDPAAFDATISVVIEALQNPDEWVVIDTRDQSEFSGARTGASAGAFGTGRMKGAVHIEWESAHDSDGLLLPRERLMELYGFIGDRKVIVYCQGGVRSAYTWLVLKDLGFDVLNYDGSWVEWSYAASTASDFPKDVILDLTEEWTDNGGRI